MITIACVYKTGPKFNINYVLKMYDRLHKVCTRKFKFVCLTDCDPLDQISNGIEFKNLKYGFEGWWSKMELFRPDVFDGEYVLYFDLDTFFPGNIDRLVDIVPKYDFMMLRGFNLKALSKGDVPASGIMSYRVGSDKPNRIYKEFMKAPKKIINRISDGKTKLGGQCGDQGFIGKLFSWNEIPKFQDHLPDGYILGKRHVLKGGYDPRKAHIVAWSGKPEIHKIIKNTDYKKFLSSIW